MEKERKIDRGRVKRDIKREVYRQRVARVRKSGNEREREIKKDGKIDRQRVCLRE